MEWHIRVLFYGMAHKWNGNHENNYIEQEFNDQNKERNKLIIKYVQEKIIEPSAKFNGITSHHIAIKQQK